MGPTNRLVRPSHKLVTAMTEPMAVQGFVANPPVYAAALVAEFAGIADTTAFARTTARIAKGGRI